MTDSLAELIKGFEGCVLRPYEDTVGKLTIGWGRNLDDKGITQREADDMLADDLADVAEEVWKALPWITRLSEARLNVLFCMAFQLGLGGLLSFHMMLNACQQGKWDIAATCMLSSKWHDQTPSRAQTLANMMIQG